MFIIILIIECQFYIHIDWTFTDSFQVYYILANDIQTIAS